MHELFMIVKKINVLSLMNFPIEMAHLFSLRSKRFKWYNLKL